MTWRRQGTGRRLRLYNPRDPSSPRRGRGAGHLLHTDGFPLTEGEQGGGTDTQADSKHVPSWSVAAVVVCDAPGSWPCRASGPGKRDPRFSPRVHDFGHKAAGYFHPVIATPHPWEPWFGTRGRRIAHCAPRSPRRPSTPRQHRDGLTRGRRGSSLSAAWTIPSNAMHQRFHIPGQDGGLPVVPVPRCRSLGGFAWLVEERKQLYTVECTGQESGHAPSTTGTIQSWRRTGRGPAPGTGVLCGVTQKRGVWLGRTHGKVTALLCAGGPAHDAGKAERGGGGGGKRETGLQVTGRRVRQMRYV